jgi:hypothetical protein
MQFTYNEAVKVDATSFCFIKILLSMPLGRVIHQLHRLTLEYVQSIKFKI